MVRKSGELFFSVGLFLVSFILISFVIGQGIVASSLLYGFGFFIYGGMGKILLFSVFGFILFYRKRLLGLKNIKRDFVSYFYLGMSFFLAVLFYFLELNIDRFSVSLLSVLVFHVLFLGIFCFLILGIFGRKFVWSFFREFRLELFYFFIFGVIVYSLMFYVWKFWGVLSFVVVRASSFLLGFFGDVGLIGEYAIRFNGFAAEIGEACSGIYSIFLFGALYLFAVILDWGKLDLGKVVLVFVPAVLGAFFVNIFRVFLLFIVGAYVSRDIAVGLYHSYVGMIFFLIYFSVFWMWFYPWAKK